MGVTSDLPAVLSLATGSVAVTPIDQASGYQTLANEGVHCVPYTVESITDGPRRGLSAQARVHRRSCQPEIAHLVTTMLRERGDVRHRRRGATL